MSYGFKSAPASRASSISRQSEEREYPLHGHQGASCARPASTRPRTLERPKRKSHSTSRTPLSKSMSQSQGNLLINDSNIVKRKEEEEENGASCKFDNVFNSTKVNLQHHKNYIDFIRRDRVYSEPLSYQKEMSLYSKKYPDSPRVAHKLTRPDVYSQDHLYDINSGNSSVEAMEADLGKLMEQLMEPQQGKASAPGHDNPLFNSEMTPPKSKPKPKVFSLLRTTPINLFSNNKSSQALSDTEIGEKRMQKPPKRAGY